MGLDAQLLVLNLLRSAAQAHDDASDPALAHATRVEALQLHELIIECNREQIPSLVADELRGEYATLLEAVQRLEDARRAYAETIDHLERSRMWMRDPSNKKGLQSRRWRPYVRATRNALRLYAADPSRSELVTEAWNAVQAGRSRAMLDTIAAAHVLGATESGPVVPETTAGVTSVRPAAFGELAAELAADTAILEYVLMPHSPGVPGAWILFVVEPAARSPRLAWQEPDLERVWEARRGLAAAADEYDAAMIQYGPDGVTPELDARYRHALDVLSDRLFPPGLLDDLRGRGYRRLVVVPDAYLLDVPFAALRPHQGGTRAHLGLPDSTTGFELAFAPSSSIFGHWSRLATPPAETARRAAMFVDPLGDLSAHNPGVARTTATIQSRLAARGVDVRLRAGDEATAEAWLDDARNQHLVVYFGHSVAESTRGGRAALMLSDGSGATRPLSADDLHADTPQRRFSRHTLFVLASCSSGVVTAGEWESDRELRGLSVAHLYAGGGAVIAAIRPLLDAPTLVLLEALIAAISVGLDAAASTTAAQRALAASGSPYAHPHCWGYVGLMGTPGWRLEG